MSPAPRPWEVVTLNIDTARVSGWSVWARGYLIASGELDTLVEAAIRDVVARALEGAAQLGLPACIVLEKPWGGSPNIVAALGAARERWLRVWRELAVGNLARVVLVQPGTWRAAVLTGWRPRMERDDCRALELAMGRALAGVAELGGDEAPAVCIGFWSSRAGEVGKTLGKRVHRQQLAALGGAP